MIFTTDTIIRCSRQEEEKKNSYSPVTGHIMIEQSHALLRLTQVLHVCWEAEQCQRAHLGVSAVQVFPPRANRPPSAGLGFPLRPTSAFPKTSLAPPDRWSRCAGRNLNSRKMATPGCLVLQSQLGPVLFNLSEEMQTENLYHFVSFQCLSRSLPSLIQHYS